MPKNISYLNKKIKLPDGWVKKSLGDIIKFHGGYVFSSKDYSSEGIPIIRISNITINGDFAYNFNDSKFCPYSMYKELKPFHLNKGDLIIALTDVSSSKSIIGRSAIIDNDKEFVMNQRVGKIDIIENQISKKFLHYYFNSTIFRYYVRKKSGKSAQANLSVNDLKKAEIVFPTSLREQNSISDFIMIMDNKVKLLEKKLKLYKKVFDKILFDSYNKNSNGHHFELIPLKNLCNIKRGTSPRPINDPKWFGNKAGWVRIKDITTAGKYLTKTEDYLSERGMQKSVGVNTGDIILSISSTLGKPVIAKMKACIHDGLVVFKPTFLKVYIEVVDFFQYFNIV